MPAQVSREMAIEMLDELIEQFRTVEFQQKLHSQWNSVPDMLEKVRLRQQLCLEIQGPVMQKHGFDATAREVSKVSYKINQLMSVDAQINCKGVLNNWLVSHTDYGCCTIEKLDLSQLRDLSPAYRVIVTRADDDAAMRGVELCRNALVQAHMGLYDKVYPGIRQNEWLDMVGSGNIRASMEEGLVILHAESVDTGEVVGYISCSESADERQFIGTWAYNGWPAQRFTISMNDDGQLHVDGEFDLGKGSGLLHCAELGLWHSTRITSHEHGKRVGLVRFRISGPGKLVASSKLYTDTDWSPEVVLHAVGRMGETTGPHANIKHFVVRPEFQSHGIARLLYDKMVSHISSISRCLTADIRLCVAELNVRAVAWYFRLGFAIVDVEVARLNTLKLGQIPVVFLKMQRRSGTPAVAWERLFTKDLRREKVVLLPQHAPMAFRAMVMIGLVKLSAVAIVGYNPSSHAHHLEDGRVVDLTEEFADGRAIFQRPLHQILVDAKS